MSSTDLIRAEAQAAATFWHQAAGQGQDWIAAHIPHQHPMCLLERVMAATSGGIECATTSHHASDHPMGLNGRLDVACGIEYAAQAMALHGALVAELQGTEQPRMGFLVSVRAVTCHVSRLDDVPGEIRVSVDCDADNGDHCVYSFQLSANEQVLLDGRAMVMLNASGAALSNPMPGPSVQGPA